MNKWLEIIAKATVGEIYIYGDITDWKFWEEDITPQEVKDQLDKLKDVQSINIYVNSPGGNVFAGVTIYNEIKRLNKPTTAYVDGIAASIASLIILAADEVVMPLNTMLMIHNPWSLAVGDSKGLRDTADKLDKITDSVLIPTYKDKTGLSEEKLKALLDAETWLSAEEAADLGFADIVQSEQKIAASMSDKAVIFKGTEIALDKFKAFPKNKFTEHRPKNILTEKQRHEHLINMLEAQI